MKNLIILAAMLACLIVYTGCNKDDDKDVNTLKITEGDFEGYSHTFTPGMGFWSAVSETVKYVHIVLGDDSNQATAAENVMSIVFYYTLNPQVQFPSAEGQWANFGINFNGTVYFFGAENATLSIIYLDNTRFQGTLSGVFVNLNNSAQKITFTMDINVMMQEI